MVSQLSERRIWMSESKSKNAFQKTKIPFQDFYGLFGLVVALPLPYTCVSVLYKYTPSPYC